MFLRKIIVAISALAIICSLNFCEAARKTVAVMTPQLVINSSNRDVADILTEKLITAIYDSGNYTVVERAQISAILKEQGFQNVAVDPNKAVELGKLTGADYTLVGKITMVDNKKNSLSDAVSVLGKIAAIGKIIESGGLPSDIPAEQSAFKIAADLRFIDNTTGEIMLAVSVEGDKTGSTEIDAVNSACKEAAENFLKELQKVNPLVARVADVSMDDIYIDKGNADGLRKDEILTVSREISPIVVNGKIVGMKQVVIAKVRVVEVNEEYSICRVIEQSYPVKEGDILKRE